MLCIHFRSFFWQFRGFLSTQYKCKIVFRFFFFFFLYPELHIFFQCLFGVKREDYRHPVSKERMPIKICSCIHFRSFGNQCLLSQKGRMYSFPLLCLFWCQKGRLTTSRVKGTNVYQNPLLYSFSFLWKLSIHSVSFLESKGTSRVKGTNAYQNLFLYSFSVPCQRNECLSKSVPVFIQCLFGVKGNIRVKGTNAYQNLLLYSFVFLESKGTSRVKGTNAYQNLLLYSFSFLWKSSILQCLFGVKREDYRHSVSIMLLYSFSFL